MPRLPFRRVPPPSIGVAGPATVLLVLLTLAGSISGPRTLEAQFRGGRSARADGAPAWWLGGGASGTTIGTVNDGRSGTTWTFAGDPRWLVRGTLEKTVQPTTTLGLAVSWGSGDARIAPLPGASAPDLRPDAPVELTRCYTADGCAGTAELWSAQLVLRGGGAREGLHQLVEVTGGVLGVRRLRTMDGAQPLPAPASVDLTAGIGYGLGYAFGPDFDLGVVQDWGIAWHAGTALPDGTSRTYRVRNTRVIMRFGFGTTR
jgi:hypothetical protein